MHLDLQHGGLSTSREAGSSPIRFATLGYVRSRLAY